MQVNRFRQVDQRRVSRSGPTHKSGRDDRRTFSTERHQERGRRISNLKRRLPQNLVWALWAFLIFGACTKPPSRSSGWITDKSQRASLSDYKGKVVLLDFYATWCQPCRVETPHLVRLQDEYGPKGLQVIGLNVGGEEDRDKVPAYAREFGVQYPLAFPDDDLVTKYLSDNDNIPQSFVFDRNGNLVKRFVGYSPRSAAELDRIVRTTVESAPQ